MDLGYIVKERREALGMSQEDLAFKMGYKNRSSINKIENGRPVTQKIIVRLAEALETTPAFLMGWNDEIENSKDNEKFIDIIQNLELTEEQKLEVIKYAKAIKLMSEQGDL